MQWRIPIPSRIACELLADLWLILPILVFGRQEEKSASTISEAAYFDSLRVVNETVFQREFEFPFMALLDKETQSSYLQIASIAHRKLFIKSFWRKQQLNPLSPKNEHLHTFLARWQYVKQNFASASPPFFDDRGRFYLKYGAPSMRYRDSGGRRTVSFFKDRELYRYISQLYSGFPPAMEYLVYPNESWVYRELGADFVIHFVKQGEGYRQITSLAHVIDSGIAKNLAWYWSDLIQSRAHLAPSFARAANNALNVQNDLITQAFARSANLPTQDARFPHDRLLEIKRVQEIDVLNDQRLAPSFFVPIPPPFDRLSFYAEIAQFRGHGDSTLLELAFLTPFQNNIILNDRPTATILEYKSFIRDTLFEPVHYLCDTCRYPAAFFGRFPNAIGLLQFSVPVIAGDLTLQIRSLQNGKMGYHKQPIFIRDFSSRQLLISDIQFYYLPDSPDEIPDKCFRTLHDIRLIPYPTQHIQKTRAAFCYFEIYNIKTAGILDEFGIKIEISREKREKGILNKVADWIFDSKANFVAIEQTRTVMQDMEMELTALDFSKLAAGNYMLTISIINSRDKSIFATSQKRITIAE